MFPYLCIMKVLFLAILFTCISMNYHAQEDRALKVQQIDSIAKSQLGVDYKYATCKPGSSFDCSGFTSYVYSSVDVPASRSSKGYGSFGEKVELSDAQPGDCILFCGTTGSRSQIGHVGIVLENDSTGLYFIHCSSSKKHRGVVLTEYYSSNYPKRFIMVRRLF